MKTMKLLAAGLVLALALSACDTQKNRLELPDPGGLFSPSDVARILSDLPLEGGHLAEVYDAVSASAGNGYDEEYLLSDLFTAPGAGVGDASGATRAAGYKTPLRDLFADYFARNYATKAGAADVEHYINALIESDMQIYWPFSEDWDGESAPVITYDPGFGAESNFGYEIRIDPDGAHVVDSLLVTETLAKRRPVWVINRNDDAAFTPLEFFASDETPSTKAGKTKEENEYILSITDLQVNRNFDSWFSGASEIFIKCGSVDGFKATKESDLRNFSPSVTDFMIVVKRRQVGKKIPFPTVLLSRYTEQIEDLALMIIEDDGGTSTSWKCSATVKYNSKSYGFEIDIPYKDKDDIIWRGPVSRKMLQPVLENGSHTLNLGDVSLTIHAE
jgi:hypothetical protein